MTTNLKTLNAGLIECGSLTTRRHINEVVNDNGLRLRKILLTETMTTDRVNYLAPGIELVSDKAAIINDGTIDVVFLSSPGAADLGLATEVLGAGKSLRILE